MIIRYVRNDGSYIGAYEGGALPDAQDCLPDLPSEVHELPENESPIASDQVWLFPGWGDSPSLLTDAELAWRSAELAVISRQLEAIEENEADETPADLLPGTRKQWLGHRGRVSAWVVTNPDFPDSSKRPVAPS